MAGRNRRSLRKEIVSINRGLKEMAREVGDVVDWYEPDYDDSTRDPIYDEGPGTGPGLVYRAVRRIPAVWIRFQPPEQVQTDQGLYTLNRISLRVPAQDMLRSGLRSPIDPDGHYVDRFGYNSFLYRVESYVPKGWLHNTYLMVDVIGRQLKPDELVTDRFPFSEVGSGAHTPGQGLGWPNTLVPGWDDQTEGTAEGSYTGTATSTAGTYDTATFDTSTYDSPSSPRTGTFDQATYDQSKYDSPPGS